MPGVFDDEADALEVKTALLFGANVIANTLTWLASLVLFRDQAVLLGTAFLAYTLGLRHAVDPDHIAAIDNVTRKLMQEGKRPISAGFFFALGHSTVVIIASLLVALSVGALQAKFAWFRAVGSRSERVFPQSSSWSSPSSTSRSWFRSIAL
jgi:high-affinity nickel-transport protein